MVYFYSTLLYSRISNQNTHKISITRCSYLRNSRKNTCIILLFSITKKYSWPTQVKVKFTPFTTFSRIQRSMAWFATRIIMGPIQNLSKFEMSQVINVIKYCCCMQCHSLLIEWKLETAHIDRPYTVLTTCDKIERSKCQKIHSNKIICILYMSSLQEDYICNIWEKTKQIKWIPLFSHPDIHGMVGHKDHNGSHPKPVIGQDG